MIKFFPVLRNIPYFFIASFLLFAFACQRPTDKNCSIPTTVIPVGQIKSKAQTQDNQFISWKEHIIDDTQISSIGISGSDGLQMADLDKDGYEDIVSVHESDTEYDGELIGHIRIAYGSKDPNQWELTTLASGPAAAAAEDVTIVDLNGDGYLDIVAACELAHLIYFENPTQHIRTTTWKSLIPSITQNRGSFIKVYGVDLDKDGQSELVAANKGDQANDGSQLVQPGQKPVSYFEIKGNPLENSSWLETEITQLNMPINSQPIDIDADGDIDVIAGSWKEGRIVLLENITEVGIKFKTHPIKVLGSAVKNKQSPKVGINGFNMKFLDINKDSRLDIILPEAFLYLVWLEQPKNWTDGWKLHLIGETNPDWIVGLELADINSDGHLDLITGGYSRGPRDKDGEVSQDDALGRIAWFENPNDAIQSWVRHDISRRKRGMFDQFVARDLDQDGDVDFVSTRGNSLPYDGVFWLEQIRTKKTQPVFQRARTEDSEEVKLVE